MTGVGLRVNLRVRGDISGPVWEVHLRVDSEVILRSFWDPSEDHLRNLINILKLSFIWPWVGLEARLSSIWVLGWSWWVPGIALPVPTRSPYPGYTPPPTMPAVPMTSVLPRGAAARKNSAVGLISVVQLSLVAHFSGSRGMTELYNLLRIDRINNHFLISGTD